MVVTQDEPLARYTTFHLGGPARFFSTCKSSGEVAEAVAYASARSLAVIPLGGGSNVLVPDEGVDALVVHITIPGIFFEERGDETLMHVGAGVLWNDAVEAAVAENLWGIENLTKIPGTVGGAAVQNIGAYGAELSSVFSSAQVFNVETEREETIDRIGAAFGYRTSVFKTSRTYIVLGVTLRLKKTGVPLYGYPDLAAFAAENPEATPGQIVSAVAGIREKKFPVDSGEGTAGSFFKNPVVSATVAAALHKRFPDLPQHPQTNGGVKISLAWLLDNALSLRGYEENGVRLFERQPLVLVASPGATTAAVEALAEKITKKVLSEFSISIEREVEIFKK